MCAMFLLDRDDAGECETLIKEYMCYYNGTLVKVRKVVSIEGNLILNIAHIYVVDFLCGDTYLTSCEWDDI